MAPGAANQPKVTVSLDDTEPFNGKFSKGDEGAAGGTSSIKILLVVPLQPLACVTLSDT